MSGKNEKYVVFKREDWDDVMRRTQAINDDRTQGLPPVSPLAPLMTLNKMEIDDAVVIRRQDVFSPGMLAAYAHSIQIAIKVAGIHEVGELNATGQRLRRIADYFHEQSELAYDESYKIPD